LPTASLFARPVQVGIGNRAPLLKVGRNAWRVARARRLAFDTLVAPVLVGGGAVAAIALLRRLLPGSR